MKSITLQLIGAATTGFLLAGGAIALSITNAQKKAHAEREQKAAEVKADVEQKLAAFKEVTDKLTPVDHPACRRQGVLDIHTFDYCIKIGLHYGQVVAAIGRDGRLVSQSANIHIYEWDGYNYQNTPTPYGKLMITFSDAKVYSKTQTDLAYHYGHNFE